MKDKERYRWYKEHGICPGCGQHNAMDGHVYCVTCAEAQAVCHMIKRSVMTKEEKQEQYKKWRESKNILRQKRKAAGLCVQCGMPSRQGKTRCAKCAEKNNAKQRERYRSK